VNAILAISLLGGLISLDHRAALSFMISQPICGGLLTGLLLGSPAEGLLVGTIFQVMFLGFVPIRGEKIPDVPLGGLAASACYIISLQRLGGHLASEGILLLGSLFFGLLISLIGYGFYRVWESKTWALFKIAMESALTGRFKRAKAIHLSALIFHFLYGFILLVSLVPLGTALITMVCSRLGAEPGGSINALQYIVPFIGAGSLIRLYFSKSKAFWFGAGFLVTYLFFIVRS
jgi:PTS system mannose-specific IIC component